MPVMAVNNENQHEQTGDDRSRPRWSAGKMEAVLRVLGGEPLEALSRQLGVEAHRLAAERTTSWRAARTPGKASGQTGPAMIGQCSKPSARSGS
jgi:hypothetical protein